MARLNDYAEYGGYRLPNTSTMERLSMKVSAGEGAVLRYDDFVIVTDQTYGGFIAAVYQFTEESEASYVESRVSLIEMADTLFPDGGHAVEWALRACK